jgi:hypothetical protein
MPLLTLLRASQGQVINWTIAAAPWPLELPPLPATSIAAKPSSPVAPAPTAITTTASTSISRLNPNLNLPRPPSPKPIPSHSARSYSDLFAPLPPDLDAGNITQPPSKTATTTDAPKVASTTATPHGHDTAASKPESVFASVPDLTESANVSPVTPKPTSTNPQITTASAPSPGPANPITSSAAIAPAQTAPVPKAAAPVIVATALLVTTAPSTTPPTVVVSPQLSIPPSPTPKPSAQTPAPSETLTTLASPKPQTEGGVAVANPQGETGIVATQQSQADLGAPKRSEGESHSPTLPLSPSPSLPVSQSPGLPVSPYPNTIPSLTPKPVSATNQLALSTPDTKAASASPALSKNSNPNANLALAPNPASPKPNATPTPSAPALASSSTPAAPTPSGLTATATPKLQTETGLVAPQPSEAGSQSPSLTVSQSSSLAVSPSRGFLAANWLWFVVLGVSLAASLLFFYGWCVNYLFPRFASASRPSARIPMPPQTRSADKLQLQGYSGAGAQIPPPGAAGKAGSNPKTQITDASAKPAFLNPNPAPKQPAQTIKFPRPPGPAPSLPS